VVDAPETRYTRSADGTNLAYQVSGDGPLDVVFVPSPVPIDLLSEDPGFIRFRRRLETFSRTVWFDARGMGASEGDPLDNLVGEITDGDRTAVLDAVGFERPALVGWDPGRFEIRFTASHPERVSALVLIHSYAHYVREDGYPWGVPPESMDRFAATVKQGWGTSAAVDFVAPSRSTDQRFRAWYARTGRFGSSPDQLADLIRANYEADLRSDLPSISCPTLVLHREHNPYIRLGAGRYLAEHIPNAKLVVLPGIDHLFFVGDTDALVRSALARHRGHEVKTTGDGFLATFDATERALRCANDILAEAKNIGLDLRAGVHSGEVEARGDDIAGLAVTIAKRVCDLAGPGLVLVSETVRMNMVGAGTQFSDHGEHHLKGVPGTWRLFSVET
jgi:pimeloyl-ACP methyl ester carboxylesterase